LAANKLVVHEATLVLPTLDTAFAGQVETAVGTPNGAPFPVWGQATSETQPHKTDVKGARKYELLKRRSIPPQAGFEVCRPKLDPSLPVVFVFRHSRLEHEVSERLLGGPHLGACLRLGGHGLAAT
jgi:hypothetical protein